MTPRRPRNELRRITSHYEWPRGARSDLALTCAGTDVALGMLDDIDAVLERVHQLPFDSMDGEASALLLRLSGIVQVAALRLDELGRLAEVPVRSGAT